MSQNGQMILFDDSELFDSDEEANYAQFTSIKRNMVPATSTQKKFNFTPYTKENVTSNHQNMQPDANTLDIASTLQEHGKILRVLLREMKLLRREQKLNQNNQNNFEPKLKPRLLEGLPLSSAPDFQKFELDIQEDPTKEEALRKFFDNIPDQSLEKFVRNSLRLIITNEAASNFSWYGRYQNIAVEGYSIMEILKECALKKFPTCKSSEVIGTIKKWFQYAKDRAKKTKSKNN